MNVRDGMKVLFASLMAVGASNVHADVVRHPLDYGMFLEYGDVYNSNFGPFGSATKVDEFSMQRVTGWFMQTTTIDERLDLNLGMAAVFFNLFSDEGTIYSEKPYSSMLGGATLIDASGRYTWGDLNNPALKITFGYMTYKYDADAQNLGEYLFRSSPYPTTVVNSSWDLENSAKARITGGVLSKAALEGKWKNDLLIVVSDKNPLFDLSPAYVTSYRINPVVELGAGVNFFHLIQRRPSETTPSKSSNGYFNYNGTDYFSQSSYYRSLNTHQDSANADTVDAHLTGASLSYYTAAGPMLMARFSIDLKPVLGDKVDLKFYGEASLLGLKNYPVFYTSVMERTPLMLGLNVPTFGVLDLLNVEAEYWKHPYVNVTTYLTDSYPGMVPFKPSDPAEHNWKWSITAKKSLGKVFSVSAKAATDHLTQIAPYDNVAALDMPGDILSHDGWYYVLRLEMAI